MYEQSLPTSFQKLWNLPAATQLGREGQRRTGSGVWSREGNGFLSQKLETGGLLESPLLRNRLQRPSTGRQALPPRPRRRLANGVPGAGTRAPVPASAPPRPPPPAAAAARPAAGAGNVQRSSAFFISPLPGRLPTHFCTSTPGASLPFFSASRGSGSSSVRSPRPLPLACLGDRPPAAPSEAHCGEPRPRPAYLCFYCPGSVSLCNPQGFGLGVGGDASSPFSFAVGGGSGDAGAGLWLRPRQLGTAPVSALLLARRAAGCAAVEPERQSPSRRPRVPHSPRPFPAARARAHTHSASPKHKQRGREEREPSRAPKLCAPLIDPRLSSRGLPQLPACHLPPAPARPLRARRSPRRHAPPPRPPTGCSGR